MKSCIFYPHSTYNFEVFNKYSNYLVHLLLFCREFSVGLTQYGNSVGVFAFFKICAQLTCPKVDFHCCVIFPCLPT